MARAVDEATKLVSDILEANYITCNDSVIQDEVQTWYDHSDVCDPEMLAAAVLEYGYWRMISYRDWCDAKEKWFCEVPVEYTEIPVWGIEEALQDLRWAEGMV